MAKTDKKAKKRGFGTTNAFISLFKNIFKKVKKNLVRPPNLD
jgi:hypothetical protein